MLSHAQRRIFAEAIGALRAERRRFLAIADDEAEPAGVQLRARLRAEGRMFAIRELLDCRDALEYSARQEAKDELKAGVP